MLPVRDRWPTERRPAFFAGTLGGVAGAALVLGVVTLSNGAGPSPAFADGERAPIEDRPRGLISAAEQRVAIIERLDRLIVTLDAIRRELPRSAPDASAPPRAAHRWEPANGR